MRTFTSIIFLFFLTSLTAQQTTQSWEFDGLEREYIQYVPATYDGSEAVPVVFCFHGLGDNIVDFFGIGMDGVADTANFITIFPQAILDPLLGTAWNSGAGFYGIFPNPDVDDVGFVLAMLDSLDNQFNIDLNRIYATGFSMGGFFTNRLACEHPEVFEAVASVAGTIGSGLVCEPASPMRIAHFHGTADVNVGYVNNIFGLNVAAWKDLWTAANGCVGEAEGGAIPDLANDGYTLDYERYGNCEGNSEVALYTVNGAAHVWLTAANDLSYTAEIWRFFLGVQPTLVTGIAEHAYTEASVYPNPASEMVRIELLHNKTGQATSAILVDMTGKSIAVNLQWSGSTALLDVSSLKAGLYVLQISEKEISYTARIVIQ